MSDSLNSLNVHKFDAEQMEEQLDHYLDPVLSFRRSAAGPAGQIDVVTLTRTLNFI
ncbi:MAG: hypothetical protein KZQ57_12040 [gamma proteobacterium symbiont of Lucinoma myriamae]|nr:hypothetical protein [gamma proteobacterium symbiont of Lucinoma myriamae]